MTAIFTKSEGIYDCIVPGAGLPGLAMWHQAKNGEWRVSLETLKTLSPLKDPTSVAAASSLALSPPQENDPRRCNTNTIFPITPDSARSAASSATSSSFQKGQQFSITFRSLLLAKG